MPKDEIFPLVATGEIKIPLDEKREPKIPANVIIERAYRACSKGSGNCAFSKVQTEVQFRSEGSDIADVRARCASAICSMSNQSLQSALNSL